MKKFLYYFLSFILIIGLSGCNVKEKPNTSKDNGKMKVVATTTMIADLARNIGKDKLEVKQLMGPGIDPHLYKASAGDVDLMYSANIIIYNGVHLEGKMGDVLSKMKNSGKGVFSLEEGIDSNKLILDKDTNTPDPHIWFDIKLWSESAKYVSNVLADNDPKNKDFYMSNLNNYLKELENLEKYANSRISEIDPNSRVLITAHDAFTYFGKAYGVEVKGLQGISTASETGTGDVKQIADFIVNRKIKAIFIESSVPKKSIEALQEAVKSRGFEVSIGGELYSDALGNYGTEEGTYIGMYKKNIDTIVNALK
ncbi:zinc transport system periplasmic zinc-binding protein TroA [Gottschalkia purinilytica]|uniref:Zinc transport system periplasmic zinc-binding protein TroA n=1 Tax=Gottschalkia purinilytica TaxID=1503 RepID=A0A0L0WB92_GOTPU|nr:zinc ABC transporter substrate-binding protein [Gottschalkia purinilytica]KNF08605.1 zinc transport system periplasmic zinc-binding protein TroA [Gottschalkia purinilytica]